ncbi:hypothetical protein GCM10007084_24380 [Parabacteroides faecis]|uniref:Lipoprotein n=2 Tax=Parabacteroides faecis TaxID=1217282 RepID=A0ABR6KNY1_9BACT|nr:hypothetical protein [Parabacteroides faecis]MBB4623126.1 hypothetical protein [Parabacteroides faecis]GGK00088.1 hypothetical protein GCM10007084_24380 [Parabacteroides faecis]
MKYLMILLSFCLMACNGRSVKQEEKTDSNMTEESIEIPNGSLTKGEQDSLITVLSPYLEVDTAFTKRRIEISGSLSKIIDGAIDIDEDYTWQIIAHVDSVIKQCINHVQSNEPKQLFDLFDKEKKNIYAHPSNTWKNEQNLNNMILSLYEKYDRSSNKRLLAEKVIELYEISFIHIKLLETFGGYSHPSFIPLAKSLREWYLVILKNYDKAIELQRQICERIEKEETEGRASENYGFELMKLSELYLANNDTIRMDSCHQILQKNPYIEKILQEYNEYKKTTQEDKQKVDISQEFESLNCPRVYIKYKQPINGYTVKVLWLPFTDKSGYTAETGNAVLHFESENNHFYIQTQSYRDTAVYSHTHLKDGDVLFWNYTPKKKGEILSKYSPFFFSDVNFDGENELLINCYNGGSKGSNTYEVYKIHPYYAEIIKDAPFASLENDMTDFDLTNKTITCHYPLSSFESITHIYKQVKQERMNFGELETDYKFELVKVDIHNQYTDSKEHKVYIKDGYNYKLVKDDKASVNQKDK